MDTALVRLANADAGSSRLGFKKAAHLYPAMSRIRISDRAGPLAWR